MRIILPFGAGGIADMTARIVAEKLGAKLGQRFLIENNPGAGGISAARTVMTADPDGYTLALFSNGTAVSVGLFNKLPFDPIKDFAPVSSLGYFDLILATSATGPYKTLGDFIKAAKEKPGTLNMGTIGSGSSQNLGAELFRSTVGADFVIVPFKTSGDVLIGLERNDVQISAEFYAAMRGGLPVQEVHCGRHLRRAARRISAQRADREGSRCRRLRRDVVERDLRAGQDAAGNHQDAEHRAA